jgi:hypothetical protein
MPPCIYEYDPHSGGNKIPSQIHEALCKQAESFARSRPWHPRIQLKLRFRNQFCYVDTIEEGDKRLFPLCRLRHFNQHSWSLALFTYSHERYEPCFFSGGKWEGTFEAALEVCGPFIV